jgi:hypothetical protein
VTLRKAKCNQMVEDAVARNVSTLMCEDCAAMSC